MQREDDIDKELQFHVDQRVADYIASGLTPAEARRRVALEFGGVTQTKEAIRDQDSSATRRRASAGVRPDAT